MPRAMKSAHFQCTFSISRNNAFTTRCILDNNKAYRERDFHAVKFTTVIIPLPILAPTFRELPLLGFGFAFRNDDSTANVSKSLSQTALVWPKMVSCK